MTVIISDMKFLSTELRPGDIFRYTKPAKDLSTFPSTAVLVYLGEGVAQRIDGGTWSTSKLYPAFPVQRLKLVDATFDVVSSR